MSFNAEGLNAGNIVFGSAGLDTGATTSQIETNATINYTINGIWYSKTATASIVLPAPSAASAYTAGAIRTIPIGGKSLFAVLIDAAGNFSITQSATVDGNDPAPVVGVEGNKAVVGVFTVKATTAAFVPGTTALGTGNTVTYYNTATMPGSSLA